MPRAMRLSEPDGSHLNRLPFEGAIIKVKDRSNPARCLRTGRFRTGRGYWECGKIQRRSPRFSCASPQSIFRPRS
jgi:hypothetical protein